MRTADLWHSDGGRLRCDLCPHRCLIAPGRTGVCGVRRNDSGTLIATTYACVSSVAIDPIEKKPVFHFHPGTNALSLGSVGCTMACGHCQNWRISRAGPGDENVRLQVLSPEEVVTLALDGACAGVAFTYNEPVIWAEYVRDTAAACREAGLYTVMVTNGYVTEEGLDYLGEVIDVWRVDIKGATDETYRQLCHVRSPAPVFDAAVRAKKRWGMHTEVVTNVIPTVNDSDDELRAIARFIAGSLGTMTPWHVTRFMPYLDYAHLDPTPLATLERAAGIGAEEGLAFVYLGNVSKPGAEDTICPSCGARAVVRDGYTIIKQATSEGSCVACGVDLGIVE